MSATENFQFYSNYPLGAVLDFSGLSLKFSGDLEAYELNGRIYQNVKSFESTIELDSIYVKKIYYARGVGVIRKELFNGQVWNLEKYKVDN